MSQPAGIEINASISQAENTWFISRIGRFHPPQSIGIMFTSSTKRAAAAAFALSMSLGATADLLQAKPAEAITQAQINQAIANVRRTGCNLGLQGGNAVITCSTEAIASLVSPELNASRLKLYHSNGKSYARYRISAHTQEATQSIPNIYFNPTGPNNLKVMPDDLNSSSIRLQGTRDGFKLVTNFESSGTEFQVEDKWFGSWKDGAFPDLHWDNARVTVNLALNRNMTFSNISNIDVSGAWSARTGANVIPDSFMNNKVRENLNGVFQNYLPLVNSLISQQLRSVASLIPGVQLQNLGLSFSNGNVSLTLPLTANAAAQQAQTRASQSLSLSKAYNIKDDEPFSNDYKKASEAFNIRVERGASATAFKPSSLSNSPRHCAGGEVRVEDWDRVEVDADGVARIWVSAELYEGTSCNSNDRDGSSIGVRRDGTPVGDPFLVVRPGESKSKTLTVNNTAEGGDAVKIKYTFANMTR
jgi:hypothetical protein